MGKRIAMIANSDLGLYNFRRELLERLIQEKYQVFLLLPDGERIKELREMGCMFYELPVDRRGTNPMRDLKLLLAIRKLLRQIHPDIVLTYTIKPNIYGGLASRVLHIPYIANITGLGTAVENKGMIQTIAILLYRMALTQVQKVFFQNKENMQFFIDYKIALGKHDLLPGSGVNLERFPVLQYPDKKKTVFAFLSRIMKEKGIDQYLEAAEYIKSKYPDTEFHVCGFCEQEYEEELKKLDSQGIIQYHGMVRDVKSILKYVHCTVHPTYYPEGISNVLLESCACARPIITTDRSGCREVMEDGKNGFVVKQKDSKDLIRIIEKFLALPWEEKRNMGLAGREKVEKEFDRRIVVGKYMEEVAMLGKENS